MELTNDEEQVLDITVDLVKAFCELPDEHPSDMEEFVTHIHSIQRLIMCRPTRRWVNRKDDSDS